MIRRDFLKLPFKAAATAIAARFGLSADESAPPTDELLAFGPLRGMNLPPKRRTLNDYAHDCLFVDEAMPMWIPAPPVDRLFIYNGDDWSTVSIAPLKYSVQH